MPRFKVSQGELWARQYVIEAETFEEAQKRYDKYREDFIEDYVYPSDPEYIDDIQGDIIWWDEKGIPLDVRKT